jgi:hypothetical protein
MLGTRTREDSAPLPEIVVTVPAQQAQQDSSALQVMAHTLIADLFGVGLRLQSVRGRVPEEFRQELDEITDYVDKVVREVRDYVFVHRATGSDTSAADGD